MDNVLQFVIFFIGILCVVSQDSTFIVGGGNAAEGAAPYQISLQTMTGRHLCGGVIVADRWILTAGLCVSGWPTDLLRVIAGTNRYTTPGSVHFPESIFMHCNYGTPRYHHDVALLQLNASITFDDLTQPISLAIGSWPSGTTELVFTGWGTQSALGDPPEQLQVIQQYHIPFQRCRTLLAEYEDMLVSEGRHICALRQQNIGACHGDSGGPLVYNGKLVGILSYFVPCAVGAPDVFMNVRYYNDWLRQVISGQRCLQPVINAE